MRTVALVLLVILSPAGAEEMVDVEPAEYRRLTREIECAFERTTDLVDVTRSLSHEISTSELDLDVRESLHHSLAEAAFAAAAEPLELAASLLDAREEELRYLAYNHLLNSEAWTANETIRGELIRLLDDPGNGEERATVVELFAHRGLLEIVRERALALAGDHNDPSLAHRVAQAILLLPDPEERVAAAFAVSEARALREEAAGALLCSETPGDALLRLLDVARDRAEPAWVRGDAVRAIAGVCTKDDPRRVAAVLELSERRFWFFGAIGNHFLVHSLALLIPALAGSDTAVTRARLEALRTEIQALPGAERRYVEWVLKHATPAAFASPSP